MSTEILTSYLSQYGFLFLFVIVLLEYMNLPGFPSGVIMPLAGIWIAKDNLSFAQGLLISVLAGLVGSWILYLLGRFGGNYLLEKYIKIFPKQKDKIEKNIDFLKNKGNIGILISKLIPVARTLISIPAGVIRLNFTAYTIFSSIGIFIWNFAFMGFGYYFGGIL